MTELDDLIKMLQKCSKSGSRPLGKILEEIARNYPEAMNTDKRIHIEFQRIIARGKDCPEIIALFVAHGLNISRGTRLNAIRTSYPCLVAAQCDSLDALRALHDARADLTVTSRKDINYGVFIYATASRNDSSAELRSPRCALYLLHDTNAVTEAELMEYLTATQFSHPAFTKVDLKKVKEAIVGYIERHPDEMSAKVKLYAYLNLGLAGLDKAKAVFRSSSDAYSLHDLRDIREDAILLLGDKKAPEVKAFLRLLDKHIQSEREEVDTISAAEAALGLNGYVPGKNGEERTRRQATRFARALRRF